MQGVIFFPFLRDTGVAFPLLGNCAELINMASQLNTSEQRTSRLVSKLASHLPANTHACSRSLQKNSQSIRDLQSQVALVHFQIEVRQLNVQDL
jgi:hypothetical protein